MIGPKFLLTNFMEKDGPIITFGDSSESAVKGMVPITCKSIILKNVFYVKCLQSNLISIYQLCDSSYKVTFECNEGKVIDSKNTVFITTFRDNLLALIIFVLDNATL